MAGRLKEKIIVDLPPYRRDPGYTSPPVHKQKFDPKFEQPEGFFRAGESVTLEGGVRVLRPSGFARRFKNVAYDVKQPLISHAAGRWLMTSLAGAAALLAPIVIADAQRYIAEGDSPIIGNVVRAGDHINRNVLQPAGEAAADKMRALGRKFSKKGANKARTAAQNAARKVR